MHESIIYDRRNKTRDARPNHVSFDKTTRLVDDRHGFSPSTPSNDAWFASDSHYFFGIKYFYIEMSRSNNIGSKAFSTFVSHHPLTFLGLVRYGQVNKRAHAAAKNRLENIREIRRLSNSNLLRFYNARPNKRNEINRNSNLKRRVENTRRLRNIFLPHAIAVENYKRAPSNRTHNNVIRTRNNILRAFHYPLSYEHIRRNIFGIGTPLNILYRTVLGARGEPGISNMPVRHVMEWSPY